MKNAVLIIGGEPTLREELEATFQTACSEFGHVKSIQEGYERILSRNHYLVVISMPSSETVGLKWLALLRKTRPMPILALTQSGKVESRISILAAGADDVLEVPFVLAECLARAQALVRRYVELNYVRDPTYTYVSSNELLISLEQRKAFLKGEEINLTNKEFDILYALASNQGCVLSYEQLYSSVWGDAAIGCESNVLWCHIRRIRDKLNGVPNSPSFIKTVRDVGYCFDPQIVC